MKDLTTEELDYGIGQIYMHFVPAMYASGYCFLGGYERRDGKQFVTFQNYTHRIELETTYGFELFDTRCKILGWTRTERTGKKVKVLYRREL